MAARLLGHVPARLGLDPCSIFLDAQRLRLCERLLGPSAGRPRAVVCPGRLLSAAVESAGLVLSAEFGGYAGWLVFVVVCAAVVVPLLLRRLLRSGLHPPGLPTVVCLWVALERSAVQLLP